jgi:hypothetical protein
LVVASKKYSGKTNQNSEGSGVGGEMSEVHVGAFVAWSMLSEEAPPQAGKERRTQLDGREVLQSGLRALKSPVDVGGERCRVVGCGRRA